MRKKIVFLLLWTTMAFAGEQLPVWVKSFDYELAPSTVKPSQINVQHLLIDIQKNWEEKTTFRRTAIKPLTQAGVEEVSHLKITFNPAFNEVNVHTIRVYRNGVWHDRLLTARKHVLQREDNLEMQMYSGILTLVYFISDIRVGDVVEYQYSIIGGNPLLTTHLDDVVYLETRSSIERISYRLLAHPAHEFKIKSFYTNLTFEIQELSSDLKEWTLNVNETDACPYEPHQPASINTAARIQINEFHTWKVVIDKMAPLVTLPENFIDEPTTEILLLIKEWIDFDPYERVRLATRFVQNEIHYLSLSDGLSALKPEDPTVCFTRRFGDCKDKTLLLLGLLKLMGISSTPILVHATNGASIPISLPSPYLFNHMILRIELDDTTIFVDPTLTLQGGSITSNYCPRYFFGLPLSENSSELISLPETKLKFPIEIETTLSLKDEQTLEMLIETKYYDQEAESIRRKLAYRGLKKLSDLHLCYFQSIYRGAAFSKPFKISDDSKENLFITYESYTIPVRTKKGKRLFTLKPFLFKDYLEKDINPDRRTPYVVTFPLWVKEHVHIDLLCQVDSDILEEMNFEHDSFIYHSCIRRHDSVADFFFEMNFLKDVISPDKIPACNEIMSTIESETDLEVIFP